MAKREEIEDLILLENSSTPPTIDERDAKIKNILKIYNERKADLLTLQNDIEELVYFCRLLERTKGVRGSKHVRYDFEYTIMLILITAEDWQIFLPESEIKRYEGVRLNMIENLAGYIRDQYAKYARQHNDPLTTAGQTTTEGTKNSKPTKQKEKAGKKQAQKFSTFFLPHVDAEKMLPILHEFMDGLIGKELAKHIVAITNVWIRQPEHKSVCKEFQAPESAYKEALDKHYCRNRYSGVCVKKKGKPFTEEDLEEIRKLIRKRYEQKTKETQE